jgi:hypothetical protein
VDPVPEEIVRFIDANVDSIEQLEILRILGDDPQRHWAAADLAQQAQIPPAAIAAQLATLQGRGLLTVVQQGGAPHCRYGGPPGPAQDMLARLLKLYSERPVTLIKLVYARAQDRLTAFSDAFRLRKDQ